MISPLRTPRIPQRWHTISITSYYFQGALIAFNHEHGRATLAECRAMYRVAKETAIKYDRRYSGSVAI